MEKERIEEEDERRQQEEERRMQMGAKQVLQDEREMSRAGEREKGSAEHACLMRQAGLCRLRVLQPAGKQSRLPCQPQGKGEERHSSRRALLPPDSPRSSPPLPGDLTAHFQSFSSMQY